MGKQKHLAQVEKLFEKSAVVSFSDVNRIVSSGKKTGYAKQLLRSLIKRSKVTRLAKGCYTNRDDAGVSVLCFKPSYLGLQSALSFHNLWEQEAIPVIITSAAVRQGIRKCMGTNILIRKSNKKYVFGYSYADDSGHYLPYSDLEKTFIDFFVFKEKLSPETIRSFREKIDVRKLRIYLSKYPAKIRAKVLKALSK